MSRSRLASSEKAVLLSVFIVIAIPMCVLQAMRGITWYSDTAFLCQATENMARRGLPLTQINASVNAAIPLWHKTAEEMATISLDPPSRREINQFERHAYFIMYALAPLTLLIPAHVVIPVATVLGFLSLLLLTYLLLRDREVPKVAAALFCVLVSCHPAWSQSLFGQPYSDRFFLPLGAFFLFLFSRPHSKPLQIAVAGAIACLVIERTGVILCGFLLAQLVLYWRENRKRRLAYLLMATLFLLYSGLVMKFVLSNSDNAVFLSSIINPGYLADRLTSVAFREGLFPFLLFNVGFLAVWAWRDPRLLLIAATVMLPNVLGSVGGAELTGWSTHYHSQYFPIVVWVAAIGFSKCATLAVEKRREWMLNAVTLALVLACAATYPYKSADGKRRWSVEHWNENAWLRTSRDLTGYISHSIDPTNYSPLAAQRAQCRTLRGSVPKWSVVSASEYSFTCLYQDREVHHYPLGMEISDYAVVIPLEDGLWGGAGTYLGPEEGRAINRALTKRLGAAGYDLAAPVRVSPSMAVLAKHRVAGRAQPQQ